MLSSTCLSNTDFLCVAYTHTCKPSERNRMPNTHMIQTLALFISFYLCIKNDICYWHVPTYRPSERNMTPNTHVIRTLALFIIFIFEIFEHIQAEREGTRRRIHTWFGNSLYFLIFLFLHMHTYRPSEKSKTPPHTHMIRTLALFFWLNFFKTYAHIQAAREEQDAEYAHASDTRFI